MVKQHEENFDLGLEKIRLKLFNDLFSWQAKATKYCKLRGMLVLVNEVCSLGEPSSAADAISAPAEPLKNPGECSPICFTISY